MLICPKKVRQAKSCNFGKSSLPVKMLWQESFTGYYCTSEGNIISLLAIGWYATKQVVPFQKTGRSWLITSYHHQLSAPIRISLGKYLILLLIKLQFWMYWFYNQSWNIVVQKYKSTIEKDASWLNGQWPMYRHEANVCAGVGRALVLSSFNRIAKTYQSLRRVQVYLRIAH